MNYLSHQADYLFEKMFLKYPQLLVEIRKPRYKVADTGFSSRNILTLDKAGLLPNRRDANSDWRKFNLNDLLFICLVKQCRGFNMDSAQLKQLNNLFFVETKNYIRAKPKQNKKIEGEEVTATEQALMIMLTEEVPIGIRIYNDGNVVIADNMSPDLNPNPSIFLDLNNLFRDKIIQFLQDLTVSSYDLSEFDGDYLLRPLTTQSKWLLRIIQKDNYSKVSIMKKNDGRLVVEGEKTKQGITLTSEDIARIESKQEFGIVEKTYRQGKIASIKVVDTYVI